MYRQVLSCSCAAAVLDIAENRIQLRLLQPLLLRDMKNFDVVVQMRFLSN